MNASQVPGRRDPHIDGNGWLTNATRLPSPNFEARPGDAVPTLIVVHNISLPPDDFSTNSIAEFFSTRSITTRIRTSINCAACACRRTS